MSTASARSILILTGSGISAESGIDTFRDKGGIWARYEVGEVATPEAFAAKILADQKKLGAVVRQAGIKAE